MVNEHTAAPYPREAEDSVIASLLVSDYAPRDVFATGLEASDFWQAKHQIAYAACKRLFEAGRPINGVSVADDLHTRGELDALGGSGWLLELTTDLPTAVAAADYAGIVARYAGFRRLLEAGQTIGQRGWQAGPDFEAALAEAEALLRGVREKAVALGKPRHIADVVAEGAERLAAWKANPGKLAGFRTGFAALDYALNGIEPGRVIMAAARTSVGKSMFAINLAFPLAEAVPVLYLSLEMTRDQLKNRALFAKAVVNRRAVQTRGYLYPDESEALDRAEGWLMGHALWLEDESSHRWGAIVGCIENAIARDGIRVVIIDHLDLIAAGNNRENRHAQLSEVMADIKALALKRDVAMLVLSQVKRTINDPPTLDDLRESGSKEETADIVAVLDRPAARHKDLPAEATLRHQLDVHVLKNRDGETGHFPLWIDVPTQRLWDWNDGKGPNGTAHP